MNFFFYHISTSFQLGTSLYIYNRELRHVNETKILSSIMIFFQAYTNGIFILLRESPNRKLKYKFFVSYGHVKINE